jgi:Initiator Replication protein, WH1/Initiator Rep protein, WH2
VSSKFNKSPVVVQSNKLVESRYILTVNEQRLVFAVASMIHPDDVDFYPYEIKIRDLAAILNIDLNNAYKNADRITDQLMQRVLVIPEDDGPLKVGWVSSCKYHNKKGTISFSFDPHLKPYLLQLKRDFTQSKLSILAQFQSIYSIRIYQLLKQYKKIGYREFGVDELKEILGIDKGKYRQFKQFRQWVLNQAKKEFEKKNEAGFPQCDLTFKLETIREGRAIDRIKFIIIPLKYQEALPFAKSGQILPIVPDRTEDQEVLEKLEYFGISTLRAKTFIEDIGREKTEEILIYYTQCLASGKVEKKDGAFLAYLLREQITGKSQFESDLETKKLEQKRTEQKEKEKEEESLRIKEEQARISLEKFQSLTEKEKKTVLKAFRENLVQLGNNRLVNDFDKEGIDKESVAMFALFKVFLRQQYFEEEVD